MYIKRLILTNFGRHRSLDLELKRGLVGMFGPNGSGKSTGVDAAYSLITNDFGRFAGVKEDNICDVADPGEESSGYIEFEHNETQFTLYRCLRKPAKKHGVPAVPAHALTINGGTPITKAPDIQTELESRLGVAFKLLGTHVFVQQWDMFAFLSQTPGERAGAYQLLCGTGKAAVIASEIERLLANDGTLNQSVIDNGDELVQRIGSLELEHTTAATELTAATASGYMSEADVISRRNLLARHTAWIRASGELTGLEQQIIRLETQVQVAGEKHSKHQKLVKQLTDLVETLKPAAVDVQLQLNNLVKHGQNVAARKQLEERLLQLTQVLEQRIAPEPHPEHTNKQNLNQTLGGIKSELTRARNILAVFDRTGTVECPTCKTPITALGPHLEEHRNSIPAFELQSKNIEETLKAIHDREAAVEGHEAFVRLQTAAITQIQTRLAAIVDVAITDTSEADLQQTVADYSEQSANLTSAKQSAAEASGNCNALVGQLKTSKQRQLELTTLLQANTVSADEVTKAEAELTAHTTASPRVAAARVVVDQTEKQLYGLNNELTALQLRLSKVAKARAFAATLSAIRDQVMHRQRLPQYVAQTSLQDMEDAINRKMVAFGNPFWVEAGEQLTFKVHFPGEPPRAAERLSGGQKGVFAVVFRESVAALFDVEIGLLTLDEPTAGMDGQNVEGLAKALTSYAAEVRGSRQVIIITHADSLRSCFDQVIDFGAIDVTSRKYDANDKSNVVESVA